VGRLGRRLLDRNLLMSTPDPALARYAEAARRANAGHARDGCAVTDGPFGACNYDDLAGVPDAAVRVSLGCGNPIAVADLRPGDTVLDLGSGGGIDVLLSARRVGPTGFAYGLDATPDMLQLARRNALEAGATNVEFLHGTIEAIPLDDASVDVVISNCVIVLSGDKDATFAEIARVLRSGGRVGISDIVRAHPDDGTPTGVSCADQAITVDNYEDALRRVGLGRVTVELTDPIGAGLSNAIIRARKPTVGIRPMSTNDWPQVTDIYAAGIATGNATFQTSPPSREEWDAGHLADHRLVATHDDTVVGWAALSAVSDRCVYAGVAESSLYIHPEHRGQGIGTMLLDQLVTEAERAGIWTIQTGIFPENSTSIAAHEAVGFRILGRRERIGQLNGVWRDTLFLERRSSRI
jgi:L-amino acid N-acyltransferase YncA/predicted O-methyltransferase YrrM